MDGFRTAQARAGQHRTTRPLIRPSAFPAALAGPTVPGRVLRRARVPALAPGAARMRRPRHGRPRPPPALPRADRALAAAPAAVSPAPAADGAGCGRAGL